MLTLDEIALTTSTDKSSRFHDYCTVYDALLSPIREKKVCIVELGILGGDSLRMWAQYFTHREAEIWGVDLFDRHFEDPDTRIATVYGNSAEPAFLANLPDGLDLCVDDASHFCSHQASAFEALWPKIKPGGIYACEDVHCVHSPQHCDMHINIIEYFARVAVEMQDKKGADGCAKRNDSDAHYGRPESIEFRKGLIIVRKRA